MQVSSWDALQQAINTNNGMTIQLKDNIKANGKDYFEVSSKGKLRALKKGTANIYVFAQNGVVKKVKVRVK